MLFGSTCSCCNKKFKKQKLKKVTTDAGEIRLFCEKCIKYFKIN